MTKNKHIDYRYTIMFICIVLSILSMFAYIMINTKWLIVSTLILCAIAGFMHYLTTIIPTIKKKSDSLNFQSHTTEKQILSNGKRFKVTIEKDGKQVDHALNLKSYDEAYEAIQKLREDKDEWHIVSYHTSDNIDIFIDNPLLKNTPALESIRQHQKQIS